MIPNITKGDKPIGLMKYLVGPGRANEHTDPHLVGGSPLIMAWHDDAQLNEEAAVSIAREIDLNRRAFGVDADAKHIWHCSLSIPYQDREVTDQEWSDIAQRFMDEMDFTDAGAKAPCQWVAVHHGRSAKGNDHIHIMASTIREDGTKWADGNDFSRAQKVARSIEKDFHLIQLGNHSERWLQQGEVSRDGTREPTRFVLERTVRACAVAADTEAQFVRQMRRANLLVHPRFAAGTDSVVTGYSVAERPPKGMRPLWFGGGKLAQDLTLPSLRTRWADTPSSAQQASEEWMAAKRHRRIVHPDAPGAVLDEETARRLAEELKEVRRRLVKIAPDDHQSWAHAAREASGVFAAWSHATEDGQGPLGRTARVLARSAHRSGVKITAPLEAPLRTSGTTAFLLAATRAPSPMVQALIMNQMLRMTQAFYEMHQAHQDLRETQLINDTFEQHLAAVAAPLPEVGASAPTGSASHAGPTRERGALRETQGPISPVRPYVDHIRDERGMEL
ncbi:relaxase [Kocuria salina]|uniref:relaxase/mobilization nuclease domain-containing protein n=1 Tax=Kocuria salina TaxID=1929416 RepID=UPI00159373C2|nr:relaxase [Kocuria salina]NVC25310.1 relaxase [Kocuria salina]